MKDFSRKNILFLHNRSLVTWKSETRVALQFTAGYLVAFITCFPVFFPCNNSIKACGIFSKPSVTDSRTLIFPCCYIGQSKDFLCHQIIIGVYLKNPVSDLVYSIKPRVRPTTNVEAFQFHLIETEQWIVEWNCRFQK